MIYTRKPVAFQTMAKPIGAVCNLNCTYCYYLEKQKLYPCNHIYRMDDATLELFIRQYIAAQEVPVVEFVWQGGEPTLMGIDFYRRVLDLQKKYSEGKQVENALQTNGTLLDDEWCRFLKANNFLVGISIDGPEDVHDQFRLAKSGEPTFKRVMESIELLKKYEVEFNTLSVVHHYNAHRALDIYRFLKQIGSGYMQFIPIVERRATASDETGLSLIPAGYDREAALTDWSVKPEEYGKFLITVFDEWVRNDVGRYFVQMFDVTLSNWIGEFGGLCVFSETCGDAVVLEHNGDMYSCDHFVYPLYQLGNIREESMKTLFLSEKQKVFGRNKLTSLPGYCLQCEYRFACHGECPKHRFVTTPDGEPGLSYLCRAYKMFFAHVHPYMQFMGDELAAKRPPANVMAWSRQI